MTMTGDPLDRLALLAAELNKASDTITPAIMDIESRLQSMNIGLEVWLASPIKENNAATRPSLNFYIGWARNADKWRIVERTSDGSSIHALAESSRARRIAGLTRLPDLIQAITARTQDAIADIKETLRLHELEASL